MYNPMQVVEATLMPLTFVGLGLTLFGIGMYLRLRHLNLVRQLQLETTDDTHPRPSNKQADSCSWFLMGLGNRIGEGTTLSYFLSPPKSPPNRLHNFDCTATVPVVTTLKIARQPSHMNRGTITVTGMLCNGCEQNVESSLKKLEGVSRVETDQEGETVKVIVDENVGDDVIPTAIEQAGYDVVACR